MTTKEVIAAIEKDEAFIKEMTAAKDPEKVYELFKGKGLTDSFEEFKATTAEMKESASKMNAAEVDAIVGGGDTTTTAITVTTVTLSASAAI